MTQQHKTIFSEIFQFFYGIFFGIIFRIFFRNFFRNLFRKFFPKFFQKILLNFLLIFYMKFFPKFFPEFFWLKFENHHFWPKFEKIINLCQNLTNHQFLVSLVIIGYYLSRHMLLCHLQDRICLLCRVICCCVIDTTIDTLVNCERERNLEYLYI